MTDHRPTFDEFDLRQALSGHATTVRPAADPSRLHDGMVRADRLRTVRAAATAGVMAVVVTFGVLNLQGVEERSLVDTVDQPDLVEPDPSLPAIDDASVDEADAETPDLETVATTTTAVPSTTLATGPDHLSPTTTAGAPVAVVSTTVPPTTAPSTTVPPATTAPPTTAPPTTSAPPTTTTTTAVAFSANARFGSCELDPPYDEYFGTAAPGATVTITSPYSSPVQVTADGAGSWDVTVFFPAAPANETFSVSVSDGTTTVDFDFVHTEA